MKTLRKDGRETTGSRHKIKIQNMVNGALPTQSAILIIVLVVQVIGSNGDGRKKERKRRRLTRQENANGCCR